jgi:hypothetical protein
MSFGKVAIKNLPPEVLKQLEENKQDLFIHQTEQKFLLVPSRSTPTGERMFLNAVEETMVAKDQKYCTHCGEHKNDVSIALTGSCTACWAKFGTDVTA